MHSSVYPSLLCIRESALSQARSHGSRVLFCVLVHFLKIPSFVGLCQVPSCSCQPRHEATIPLLSLSVPSCSCQPRHETSIPCQLAPLFAGPPPLPLMFCLKAMSMYVYAISKDDSLVVIC